MEYTTYTTRQKLRRYESAYEGGEIMLNELVSQVRLNELYKELTNYKIHKCENRYAFFKMIYDTNTRQLNDCDRQHGEYVLRHEELCQKHETDNKSLNEIIKMDKITLMKTKNLLRVQNMLNKRRVILLKTIRRQRQLRSGYKKELRLSMRRLMKMEAKQACIKSAIKQMRRC